MKYHKKVKIGEINYCNNDSVSNVVIYLNQYGSYPLIEQEVQRDDNSYFELNLTLDMLLTKPTIPPMSIVIHTNIA